MIDLKQQRESAQKWVDKGCVSIGVDPRALVTLLDMLEAANLDAARYQWLRESKHFDSDQHQIFCAAYGHALDVAIDAAMAATKGEQA